MKFWIHLLISIAIGAACVYLAWPSRAQYDEIHQAFLSLHWRWLGLYLVTLAGVHLLRSWRWNYLLRPLGTSLPLGRLVAVSSVGFMAILALPARLGEFVRPYLVAERGRLRFSAGLGTIAVERIIDGLLISVLVFVSFWALKGPNAPGWMMLAAWASLLVFGVAAALLGAGIIWPEGAARLLVRATGLRWISPRLSARVEHSFLGVCSGFRVLGDARNLGCFLALTIGYWVLNGFGMWLLAFGFDLPLSPTAAFATMGLTGVGITLPNAPGLVGQFHYFSLLGLSLYLPPPIVQGKGVAYTAVLHGTQLIWYIACGCVALFSSHASLVHVVRASRAAAEAAEKAQEPAR